MSTASAGWRGGCAAARSSTCSPPARPVRRPVRPGALSELEPVASWHRRLDPHRVRTAVVLLTDVSRMPVRYRRAGLLTERSARRPVVTRSTALAALADRGPRSAGSRRPPRCTAGGRRRRLGGVELAQRADGQQPARCSTCRSSRRPTSPSRPASRSTTRRCRRTTCATRPAPEFASQADQYDVATLSNFEIPFYAKTGWLAPLTDYAQATHVRPGRHPAVDDQVPVR